jgi:D-alanyl-D-alanine carboxypeptidase
VNILKRNRRALFFCAARFAFASLLILAAVGAPLSEAHAAKKRSRSAAPSMAAAIVIDMNAGTVLYAKEADTQRYPASLTKVMTLYVLFGYLRAGKITTETELEVTPHAASQSPTKLGLKPGTTIKTSEAIKALVTHSANDAAATIAENIGGTEENFVRMMTQTARSIGMKNTTFRNASGLPNTEQVTTARDMAILAVHMIRDYPEYYGVFATKNFTYRGRNYRNHNKLLLNYRGTDGIKTGYTRASGFNLTASVKRDDKHLIAVVMGGRTGAGRDAAMRSLLDKNFPAASTKTPAQKSLVASLVEAISPPAPPKKPAFALASASMPALKPAAAATPREEGDIDGPGDVTPVSLTAPASKISAKAAKRSRYEGSYHVQVGAYTSQPEADNRLGMVQQRAAKLLDGHLPFTATFVKDETEWYRARFAGFSKGDAQSTCEALKELSLDCVVMSAE